MGTFVRTFARVNPPVSGQARGLCAEVSTVIYFEVFMPPTVTYIRETLTAVDVLALVRFLARVRADMYCQGTPLDETLPAPHGRALVWSFIGVYPVVSLQVRLPVEALQPSQHPCSLCLPVWPSATEELKIKCDPDQAGVEWKSQQTD
jgi:hypothetical protein